MADISKCQNISCPKHEKCYRFVVKAGHWQSYSSFAPNPDGSCDYFYEIPNYDVVELLEEFYNNPNYKIVDKLDGKNG